MMIIMFSHMPMMSFCDDDHHVLAQADDEFLSVRWRPEHRVAAPAPGQSYGDSTQVAVDMAPDR